MTGARAVVSLTPPQHITPQSVESTDKCMTEWRRRKRVPRRELHSFLAQLLVCHHKALQVLVLAEGLSSDKE
jgi:hypothetical protein